MAALEKMRKWAMPPYRDLLLWYMRIISGLMLGAGVIHWARIVSYVPWRGRFFPDMPTDWQAATVYFAVIDLVASIGLWLGVSWGAVIWLVVAASQILMHSAFSDTFGRRPYEITFYVITILIYLALVYLSERQARKGS